MQLTPDVLHKRINDLLLIAVLLLGIYLVITPVWPEISFRFRKVTVENSLPLFTQFGPFVGETQRSAGDFKVKRLEIPSILVDGEVLVGDSSELLNQGIWHRPGTSTPDQGGNSVFVAHRFQYTSGPNTFYHLDKVKVGEEFFVNWEGERYEYEVFEVLVVPPDAFYIEDPTDESIVTLYTCTPLWTAAQRLVVRGKLRT